MKKINEVVQKDTANYPERILQFGEGNFLRAFADWMVNTANHSSVYQGSIVLCQPIAQGLSEKINEQNGIYTLAMRGIENGEPVERIEPITSVSRCINPYESYGELLDLARSEDLQVVISNTTEAGISYHAGDKHTDTPPVSFPAKVCAFLYERFEHFRGDESRGLLFLPVELIDNNGANLKRIVLQYATEWDLGDDFYKWVDVNNHFCSTLVDRIVTGYPHDEIAQFEEKLGYKDQIIVTSEIFNLWVIEGEKKLADILPIHKINPNVIWTDNVAPYKQRKVRILNGGHTASVLAAFLAGHSTVLDMMNDDIFTSFLDQLFYSEIIPTLDLPKADLEAFALAVKERFANPFIKHQLLDISLNSCSKWCARCMPSLLEYVQRKSELPSALSFSLAALIQFYKGVMRDGAYTGKRSDGVEYTIRDEATVLNFFAEIWSTNDTAKVAEAVLGNTALWNGNDLRKIGGLTDAVAVHLSTMAAMPMRDVVGDLI